MSAIVANQEQNPNLVDINLRYTGVNNNEKFSSSAKEHITALIAKGLTIAEDDKQWREMNKRIHSNELGYWNGAETAMWACDC